MAELTMYGFLKQFPERTLPKNSFLTEKEISRLNKKIPIVTTSLDKGHLNEKDLELFYFNGFGTDLVTDLGITLKTALNNENGLLNRTNENFTDLKPKKIVKKEDQKSNSNESYSSESESNRNSDLGEDGEIFCLCRKIDNGESLMVRCDGCEEWFHCECIGMSMKGFERTKKKVYKCLICQISNPIKRSKLTKKVKAIIKRHSITQKKRKKEQLEKNCQFCKKSFLSTAFLAAHCATRHKKRHKRIRKPKAVQTSLKEFFVKSELEESIPKEFEKKTVKAFKRGKRKIVKIKKGKVVKGTKKNRRILKGSKIRIFKRGRRKKI